jgi:hypothetical protein
VSRRFTPLRLYAAQVLEKSALCIWYGNCTRAKRLPGGSTMRYAGRVASTLLLAALCGSARADIVFTDDTFNLGNYSATASFSSDPTASIAYSSSSNTLEFVSSFGDITLFASVAVALLNNGFVIDPSTQGAITSIDASITKDNTIESPPEAGAFTNTFRPAILQGGVLYVATLFFPGFSAIPYHSGFQNITGTGLQASDFVSFDLVTGTFGSSHPDFAGDPMVFGLLQRSALGGFPDSGTARQIADFQNLVLVIHGVPEPGTASLLLLALGLLAAGLRMTGRYRRGI